MHVYAHEKLPQARVKELFTLTWAAAEKNPKAVHQLNELITAPIERQYIWEEFAVNMRQSLIDQDNGSILAAFMQFAPTDSSQLETCASSICDAALTGHHLEVIRSMLSFLTNLHILYALQERSKRYYLPPFPAATKLIDMRIIAVSNR